MDGVSIRLLPAPFPFPLAPYDLRSRGLWSLQRSVQFLGHGFFARPAALGPSKEGLTAGRAVVSFAFRPRPFGAALFVPLFGDVLSPDWDRPFHDFHSGGENEIFDEIAGPFPALMAGVIPFGFHATADLAGLAEAVDLFRRVRLHATQAFRFFRLGPVEISHHRLELLIAVSGGEVNSAGPAIQPAGGHQLPVSELFLGPSFHGGPALVKE